jgi:ABC-2 type transport system permease protein
MPALIFVNGKVSVGHILVGYLGMLLLGALVTAIGLFASALAQSQVVAAILAAVLVGMMYMWKFLAKTVDPPLTDFLANLDIHYLRLQDFMNGVLRLDNVAFYLAAAFFFLLASVKTLEARRWR